MFWNLPTRRKAGSEPRWLSKGFTHSLSIFSIPCSTSDFWQISFELICRSDSIYWLWVLWDCLLHLYSCPSLKSHQESFQEFAINPGKLCQTNITSPTNSKSISWCETFSALLELVAFGALWLCGLVRPSAMAFAPQHLVPTICLACYLLPDNRTIIRLQIRVIIIWNGSD